MRAKTETWRLYLIIVGTLTTLLKSVSSENTGDIIWYPVDEEDGVYISIYGEKYATKWPENVIGSRSTTTKNYSDDDYYYSSASFAHSNRVHEPFHGRSKRQALFGNLRPVNFQTYHQPFFDSHFGHGSHNNYYTPSVDEVINYNKNFERNLFPVRIPGDKWARNTFSNQFFNNPIPEIQNQPIWYGNAQTLPQPSFWSSNFQSYPDVSLSNPFSNIFNQPPQQQPEVSHSGQFFNVPGHHNPNHQHQAQFNRPTRPPQHLPGGQSPHQVFYPNRPVQPQSEAQPPHQIFSQPGHLPQQPHAQNSGQFFVSSTRPPQHLPETQTTHQFHDTTKPFRPDTSFWSGSSSSDNSNRPNNPNKPQFQRPPYDFDGSADPSSKPNAGGGDTFIFPNEYDTNEISQPNNNGGSGGSAAAEVTEPPPLSPCERNCPVTPEFNPVCGSDSVTYNNFGRLKCARNCGKDVSLSHYGTCRNRRVITPPSFQSRKTAIKFLNI